MPWRAVTCRWKRGMGSSQQAIPRFGVFKQRLVDWFPRSLHNQYTSTLTPDSGCRPLATYFLFVCIFMSELHVVYEQTLRVYRWVKFVLNICITKNFRRFVCNPAIPATASFVNNKFIRDRIQKQYVSYHHTRAQSLFLQDL
jgi:hypothetical protein